MNLRHLKAFVSIVQHGGVGRAAVHLHVSQPALSASLKALEQDLDCALFDRSRGNRRVRLTPSGQRFYSQALAILRACDEARAELRGEEPPAIRVRVGLLDTLPHAWVRRVLGRLSAGTPRRAIEIWEGSAERLAGWLEQERLDAAISTVEDGSAGARVLWRETFVAVASRAHPFAKRRRRTIAIRDLAEEPFVFRSHCEMSPVGEAQLRAAGIRLRTVVRAAREELAFASVAHGLGVTLAPRSVVPAGLVPLVVTGLSLSRTIGLQWRAGLDRLLVDDVYRSAAAVKPGAR